MKTRALLVVSLSSLSVACAAAPDPEESEEDPASIAQPERWSSSDDPALFANNLERNLERLPTEGSAAIVPWAGNYWPTGLDSINYRWAGANSLSPAKKYEQAFGVTQVEDQVSRYFGVDSQMDARACTNDNQCNQAATEICGKRAGSKKGRCIPSWFGICDAWSAASILFPEPQHPVVQNGVTFAIQDIKALMSLVSTKTKAKAVSLRCEGNDRSGSIAYDAYGRPAAQECRDSNPGTLHIVLANYIGMQKKSLVEDRTFDYQVWNQPIRGYKITSSRRVSVDEANRLVTGGRAPRYLFNDKAKALVYVQNDVSYILESTPEADGALAPMIDTFTGHAVYSYILELDGSGAIIGGEWIGANKRNHPDFLWVPTVVASTTVAGGAIRYEDVKALADASVAP